MDLRVAAATEEGWPGEEVVEVEIGGEEKDLSRTGGREPERDGERWFGREGGVEEVGVGPEGSAVAEEDGDPVRGSTRERESKLLSEEATESSRWRALPPSLASKKSACFVPSPSIS